MKPEPRIGDAERDRTVSLLQEHARAGRIDAIELDERVEAALQAKTASELAALTRDLPDQTQTPRGKALAKRRKDVQGFREHATSLIVLSIICIAIWAATGAGYFWPMWPIGFWAITVIGHGASLLNEKGEEDA
jgi:hypothetical protein